MRTIIEIPKADPDSREVLETTDLYLAAFFIAMDVELLGSRRAGSRCYFQFQRDGEIEGLRTAWYANQASVMAQTYAGAIKNLKAMVHSI